MKERLLEGNLYEGRFDFRLLFSSGIFLWSTTLSFPAGTDSLFFVLPKKSKQKKGAPEMAKASLNFRNRAEAGKTRCAQTVPRLFPPAYENSRRHQGLNVKRERPTHREVGLCRLGRRRDGLAVVL